MASVTLTSPPVTTVDFNKYSNVPHELKALPNWVCHRKKLPFHPSGYAASSTNPNTWTTFEEAVRHEGNFDGIGFMFSGSGYVGIDIDKCRDPQTGVAEEWAREILKSVNSFSELSFNGTGFHIFAKGSKPGPRCKFGRLEIYDSDRYFTVSGIALQGLPSIESRDITWLYDRAVAGEFDQTATKVGQVAGTGSQ